jgi:AcrR family transcriptional regulator
MFVDSGFAETSMRDIAANLDVTTAALYYHFENKDDLLLAAVTPALEDVDQLLSETKRSPRGSAGQRAFLGQYAELMLRHQAAMRLINRDPAVAAHPGIGPHRQRIEREIAARLSSRKGPRARALSFAAIGAMLLPILSLDRSELAGVTDALVQSAIAVLGA